ncbi:MAG: flagellar filament capping protein FliD [Oscillospiraceae bacterium]|jgi:flagellar hook-associated protein 2|nr:flagellar filament capping protein FliD [Oscillospiraceae bacterium]
MTIGNQVRLTGMMSGLDTDAIVRAMVSGQQLKIDRLNQHKDRAEWKKDLLTDFNNQLKQFRDNYASVLGAGNLVSKSSFVKYSLTVAQTTTAVAVTATSAAKAGAYSIRVEQIAAAATMHGAKLTTIAGGYSPAVVSGASISSLTSLVGGAYTGADEGGNFSFSINGVDFSFKTSQTFSAVMSAVNASSAGVTMSYSQITDSFTITSKTFGAASGAPLPGDAPEAPDPSEYVNGEDDAQYIVDKAAYESELADYNQSLKEYNSDKARNITVDDDDGFLAKLGLSGVTAGHSAVVSVNGGAAQEFETNSFTLDGITFDLKASTAGQTVNFSLAQDVTSVVESLKTFVEDFNKLIKTLFDAFNEKKNYKYNPLTEAQRADMKDSEIEDWTNMAKAGLLARDNRLGTLLNSVRQAFSAVLGGEGTAASIGIKTSSYRSTSAWSIEFDAELFAKTLAENPDKVFNIFAAAEKSGSNGGLVNVIAKAMDKFVADTKSHDISNLTQSVDGYVKSIKEQEDKLYTLSERYYMQYAKMETALAQMQSQTDQLMNLFATGNNNNKK